MTEFLGANLAVVASVLVLLTVALAFVTGRATARAAVTREWLEREMESTDETLVDLASRLGGLDSRLDNLTVEIDALKVDVRRRKEVVS